MWKIIGNFKTILYSVRIEIQVKIVSLNNKPWNYLFPVFPLCPIVVWENSRGEGGCSCAEILWQGSGKCLLFHLEVEQRRVKASSSFCFGTRTFGRQQQILDPSLLISLQYLETLTFIGATITPESPERRRRTWL